MLARIAELDARIGNIRANPPIKYRKEFLFSGNVSIPDGIDEQELALRLKPLEDERAQLVDLLEEARMGNVTVTGYASGHTSDMKQTVSSGSGVDAGVDALLASIERMGAGGMDESVLLQDASTLMIVGLATKAGVKLGMAGLTRLAPTKGSAYYAENFGKTITQWQKGQVALPIWHYTRRAGGFTGDVITAGAAGRHWATVHAPTGWHNGATLGSKLLRGIWTGKTAPFTDVRMVVGVARGKLSKVTAVGPWRAWKRFGGQYFTRRPGDINLSTGIYPRVTDAQVKDFLGDILTYHSADVLFDTITIGGVTYIIYIYGTIE